MPTPLEISTQPGADGIPVVTVAGEIDTSNAERFRDALGQAAAAADAAALTPPRLTALRRADGAAGLTPLPPGLTALKAAVRLSST